MDFDKMTKDNIWSREKILKEATYTGFLFGGIGFIVANLFGKRVLGLTPKVNLASSIATMVTSGYMYRGIYYKELMAKQAELQLLSAQEPEKEN
ncbi:hypothetical protein AYI70_g4050 [Smittium culicis]|uniref:Uncharacterized protein n=1 Tax=Smittium culicis TaxID=133412 RepID=A0A1R1Y0P8_9FUNG|nr:hypothetical protein AYI70_g4050 [Smittium culicis]